MYRIILALAFSALATPIAFASGNVDVSGLIRPGLYEVTTQMTMAGMGEMPAQTRQHCLTEDQVKNFVQEMADKLKQSKSGVEVKDISLHGKQLHIALGAPQGTMTLDVTFDDTTHYHQVVNADISGQKMTGHSTGHRVGDCKKDDAS